MAAAEVDAGYIAQAYSVPEPTIASLLDAPTIEHVKLLLSKIEEKAREFEDAQAEKLRTDVELETAVRNGNARAKQLKESVDKGLKEIEDLRKKLAAEETARANLESELQNAKSSSSTSTSQVEAFRSRIAFLESANQDALALLESKSTAHDKLAEEVGLQQQKIVALRKEVSELEAKVQSSENASMQYKFREQRLQEEVELLKKRDEWNAEELQRRTSEHTKYRKEKTAQVAEFQRTIEDITSANETLRSNETQLRNRLDEVTRKLEDAYMQIQNKDEDAVRRENSSRAERDNALRLAELQKKSADTARARQQELERALDQLREDAAEEIGNLQADVNAERKDKETAEVRVQELEKRVEELQAEIDAGPQQTPATPRRSLNGTAARGTPARAGSPFSPGTSRLKTGMTMTQMVTAYSTLKAEFDREHRTANELRAELDNMIAALENKQPEIEEATMDRDRLQGEVEQLGSLLEQSQQDRDAARKAARKWQSDTDAMRKQEALLRQQLRDLSTQVKILLVELNAKEVGLISLSKEQQEQYHAIVYGNADEADLVESPTQQFITQRLVAFRTADELIKQNEELRTLVRKLGEEMEGEEARAKKNQQEQDQLELEELREKVAEYKDSIQSLTTRSESYIRERDMFRRMLAHRGQLPQGFDASAMFGDSFNSTFMPGTPARAHSTEPSADSRALADHIKLLKELQLHFDAYREEAATDQAALKRQADTLSREKSDLQGENARLMSKEAIAQERYSLLQANYTMLKNENSELQKRWQLLSENAAKQDLKTQQVAEDLVEARALAESMRNETANLKAEKELWKRVETRLTEDNQSLLEERSRLNKMVSDLQSLQNERELADSENRRKLQARVETLESELSTAKRKLDEEVEQAKKAALRREYETEQNRTRIEDLLKSSANYKEELVAVKTQRDQLQARVDELKIELRNAEEKAQVLQPRLTSRPTPGGQASQNDENALSREQELAIEVADLKRDLELIEGELQSVKDEIEQYKSIAQTAEEELQQMNETTDQYRQETDAAIAEKDSKIKDLETRIEEISSELASTNTELSELRSKQDEAASKFNDQKQIYESELARLRDESDRLAETARLHQEDLKAQAEIAQQAQQNYEDELVKHAEAASSLQKLRSEHHQLKTEIAGYKAEAEAAKLSLSQSEESWTETRTKYEQELTEIKNSREDLKTQNRRLHTQLEDLSKQIDNLRKTRAANGPAEEDANATPDPTSNNLQDIIRYLRQEKDIVDMQYELQIQESKRLQQQLSYANSQLDDVREKLEAERRSNTSASEQATSHSKLMQTINELNLFRESNSSLRNEARSAQEQLAKKVKEVQDLVAQLEPLKSKAREAEYELEAKQGEIKLLQEDRDRWQKRTQDIMQKYDRVDPAELQELRDQISNLTAERDAAVNEKAPLQAQLDEAEAKHKREMEEQTKTYDERRAKIIEQSKQRDKQRREQIEGVQSEQKRLADELASVKSELEEVKKARDEAQAKAAMASNSTEEEGQVTEDGTGGMSASERAMLESQVSTAQQKADSEASRASALEEEVGVLNSRIETLKAQITELEQSLAAAKEKVEAAQASHAEASTSSSEALEKLQADLTAAQAEIDRLKTAETTASFDAASQEQVEAAIASLKKDLEEKQAALDKKIADQDELHRARSKKTLEDLNQRLRDKRASMDAELVKKDKEHQEELAKVKQEYEEQLEKFKTEPSTITAASDTPAAPATNDLAAFAATFETKFANMPQSEVRGLLNSNPTLQGIIKKNISNMTDAIKAQLEAEKKSLQAARETMDAEKEKALAQQKLMIEKKSQLQVTMAKKKADELGAQIEVVKTAAKDTPQRPVVEVWEIASNTKAGASVAAKRTSIAPVAPPAAASAPVQVSKPDPVAALQAASASITQPAAPASAQPQPSTTTTVTPVSVPGGFGAPSGIAQPARRLSNASAFGKPSGLPTPGGGNPFAAGTAPGAGRGSVPAATRNITPNGTAAPTAPTASTIPRPGSALGGPQSVNAARGRGASQLPRGGPTRGGASAIARGGVAAQRGGRGGLQTSNLPNAGAGRGAASPRGGRGALNANAAAFAPGQKRPNDGSGGNEEKKVKEG